ncbi:MAG: C-type lectin domain-containing protein [Planctomycetes bacterium]|nr:C-type lectin domain-containing protein [Planctomycetota bacterium]
MPVLWEPMGHDPGSLPGIHLCIAGQLGLQRRRWLFPYPLYSTVSVQAEAGATYMVRVGGVLGSTGSFRLRVECSSIIDVGTHGANTYYLLEPATWHEGQMMARAMGGNLVTIDDQAEQDYIWNRWGQNRNL